MAQAWPLNVPNILQQSGFSYSRQSGVIRTDMDTGPAKVRRRFTAVVKKYRGQLIMTRTEFSTFETWFETIIMMGSLTFMFPDPLDTVTLVEFRFDTSSDPWTAAPAGDTDDMIVTLNLERIIS